MPAHSMRARKTRSFPSSTMPIAMRRSKCASSISAPMSTSRSWRPPSACSARSGKWPVIPAFLAGREAARARCRRARRRQHLLHRRHRVAARRQRLCRPSRARSSASAPWRRRSRANWVQKNIHVAHLIIDAGVDIGMAVRQRRLEALGPNALDDPDLPMPPALCRRCLLAALSAAEERLDIRVGDPSLWREMVGSTSDGARAVF